MRDLSACLRNRCRSSSVFEDAVKTLSPVSSTFLFVDGLYWLKNTKKSLKEFQDVQENFNVKDVKLRRKFIPERFRKRNTWSNRILSRTNNIWEVGIWTKNLKCTFAKDDTSPVAQKVSKYLIYCFRNRIHMFPRYESAASFKVLYSTLYLICIRSF